MPGAPGVVRAEVGLVGQAQVRLEQQQQQQALVPVGYAPRAGQTPTRLRGSEGPLRRVQGFSRGRRRVSRLELKLNECNNWATTFDLTGNLNQNSAPRRGKVLDRLTGGDCVSKATNVASLGNPSTPLGDSLVAISPISPQGGGSNYGDAKKGG